MSTRLRSTPWWEQCEDFYSSIPETGLGPHGLFIGRNAVVKGLGHQLELVGYVNAQDPDGTFFVKCPYCVRAATRRRRLAQPKMVIILDYDFGDSWLDIAEIAPNMLLWDVRLPSIMRTFSAIDFSITD